MKGFRGIFGACITNISKESGMVLMERGGLVLSFGLGRLGRLDQSVVSDVREGAQSDF